MTIDSYLFFHKKFEHTWNIYLWGFLWRIFYVLYFGGFVNCELHLPSFLNHKNKRQEILLEMCMYCVTGTHNNDTNMYTSLNKILYVLLLYIFCLGKQYFISVKYLLTMQVYIHRIISSSYVILVFLTFILRILFRNNTRRVSSCTKFYFSKQWRNKEWHNRNSCIGSIPSMFYDYTSVRKRNVNSACRRDKFYVGQNKFIVRSYGKRLH